MGELLGEEVTVAVNYQGLRALGNQPERWIGWVNEKDGDKEGAQVLGESSPESGFLDIVVGESGVDFEGMLRAETESDTESAGTEQRVRGQGPRRVGRPKVIVRELVKGFLVAFRDDS